MIDWAAQLAGGALIATALFDVYRTVLSSGAGRGPIERNLSRGIWRAFRLLENSTGRSGKLAASCGPILVAALLASWSALLILGFALLFWPLLGSQVQASGAASADGFGSALYLSGFSFTTLGVGDVYPAFGFARFLSILEAWIGFTMLTLSISYLLSVYQAVRQRNALATSLHAMSGGTGDSRELLLRLLRDEQANGILNELRAEFANLETAHRQYPVVHYFQLPASRYSTVRVFFLVCDYLALCRSLGLAREDASFEGLRNILDQSVAGFCRMIVGPSPQAFEQAEEESEPQAWDERLESAVELVRSSAPPHQSEDVSPDVELYRSIRKQWNAKLRAIADYLAQDWEAICDPTAAKPEAEDD